MPQWTPDLAVGVPEIDKQHQDIFKAIDDLMEACNQGKGRQAVGEVIKFLEQYVVDHFGAEEKYMSSLEYPKYKEHKKLHDQFIQDFTGLKDKFQQQGPGINLVVQTNKVVVAWLQEHIRRKDKELGAFLQGKI